MSIKTNPHGVISISCSLDNSFFKYWFEFLKPFHNLTGREMDVIVSLTKHRHQLSKVVKDDVILDKVVMSEDVRKQVREECNLSLPHFQVIMGKLRDNKVIVNNKINPRFIPNIKEEDGNFKLMLLFDFNK